MTAARNAAIGLCIAPHRMVARALSGGASSRVSWERPLGGDGIVPGTPAWRAQLDDALRALRTTAPLSRELHVALAPPLAEVRVVALPTIGPLELGAAVERDAAKYFPVGAERQVIAVRTVGVATSGFAPHLVSAAAAAVVGDVLAAAAAAGFQVASIAPAQVAWVRSAAQSRAGAFGAPVRAMGTDRDATRSLLVRLDGRDDLFDVLDGDIVRVRRRPAAAGEPGSNGTRTLAGSLDEALDLAARHADQPRESSLWPAAVRAARDTANWRRAGLLTGVAAALALVALWLAWAAAGRDVGRIAAEREALRPRAAAAAAAADSLSAIARQTSMLRAFASAAPRWSSVIVAIGAALPRDASLLSMKTSGDTIVLTGEAGHAAPVFAALARSAALAGVRAEAPIQQQVENGEVVAERFTIAARLAPPRPR